MTKALRVLSLILCFTLFSLSAFAEDAVFDDEMNIMEAQPTFGGAEVETNVFGDLKAEGPVGFADIEDDGLRYKAEILYNLKFISIYPDGTFRPDVKITKGDFVCSVLSLLNMDYEDNAQDIYTPAIKAACDLKMVIGDENNKVNPYEYLSYTDACTILVRALGYEDLAVVNGGYPVGYLNQAKKIGLYTAEGNEITRGDAAQLLYSALDASVMKQITYGNTAQFEADEDNTVLGFYHNMYPVSGRVNASYISALPGYELTARNVLTIGDADFIVDEKAYTGFLGYYVDAYYTNYDGIRRIVCLCESQYAESIEIDADDINDFSNLKYEYYSGDKLKNCTIAPRHALIINGIVAEVYGESDFIPENGKVKLLSYRGGNYDVVVIESFYPFALDKAGTDAWGNPQFVSMYELPLYTIDLTECEFNLYVNDNKCSFGVEKIETYDPDGNAIVQYQLPSIPTGCIVNIFADKYDTVNGSYLPDDDAKVVTFKIYTDREISGRVDAIGSEKLIINGTEYESAKRNLFDKGVDKLSVGSEGRFLLDYDGKICALISDADFSELQYAYLINAAVDTDPMQDKARAKILLSNGKIETFDISDKVRINGDKAETPQALITRLKNSAGYIKEDLTLTISQLVKFKCNSAGEIIDFETVLQSVDVPAGADENHIHREALRASYASRSENGNSLYFNSGNYSGMLAYNGKPGLHFKVPKVETFKDADYSVSTSWGVNMSVKVLDVYNCSFNLVPEVIIEYCDVDPALDYPYVLVESVSRGLDENGDIVGILNCVTGHTNTGWLLEDGKEVYYSYNTDLFNGLECGDFIYLYGTGKYISRYDMMMSIDTVKNFDMSVMPTPAATSQKYDLYELYAIWKSYNFILQRGPVTEGTKRAYQQINYFNKLVDYGGFVYDCSGREPKVSALYSANIMDAAINCGNERASRVYIWESSTVTKLMVVYIGL